MTNFQYTLLKVNMMENIVLTSFSSDANEVMVCSSSYCLQTSNHQMTRRMRQTSPSVKVHIGTHDHQDRSRAFLPLQSCCLDGKVRLPRHKTAVAAPYKRLYRSQLKAIARWQTPDGKSRSCERGLCPALSFSVCSALPVYLYISLKTCRPPR